MPAPLLALPFPQPCERLGATNLSREGADNNHTTPPNQIKPHQTPPGEGLGEPSENARVCGPLLLLSRSPVGASRAWCARCHSSPLRRVFHYMKTRNTVSTYPTPNPQNRTTRPPVCTAGARQTHSTALPTKNEAKKWGRGRGRATPGFY